MGTPPQRPLLHRLRPPRRVPFVGHQLAEYALALGIGALGLHVSGSAEVVLLATGGALLLLGLLSAGPLGVVPMIGRRLHHGADVIVVLLLACSPLAMRHHPDGAVIALVEVIALVLLRVERGTRYRDVLAPARAAEAPAGTARPVVPTPASSLAAPPSAAPPSAPPPSAARLATGRSAGIRRRTSAGAYRAGLVAGNLRRFARTARRPG